MKRVSILGQTETHGLPRQTSNLAPRETDCLTIFVQHLLSGGELVSARNFVAIENPQARPLPGLTNQMYTRSAYVESMDGVSRHHIVNFMSVSVSSRQEI